MPGGGTTVETGNTSNTRSEMSKVKLKTTIKTSGQVKILNISLLQDNKNQYFQIPC